MAKVIQLYPEQTMNAAVRFSNISKTDAFRPPISRCDFPIVIQIKVCPSSQKPAGKKSLYNVLDSDESLAGLATTSVEAQFSIEIGIQKKPPIRIYQLNEHIQ